MNLKIDFDDETSLFLRRENFTVNLNVNKARIKQANGNE